jgi:hypothetical protein
VKADGEHLDQLVFVVDRPGELKRLVARRPLEGVDHRCINVHDASPVVVRVTYQFSSWDEPFY